MMVLGLETSCDETSAAVVADGRRTLSNIIHSQLVHQRYGGVVPELAGREHIRRIVPIMEEALGEAGKTLADIEGFAATFGPGLVGALLVGLSFAKVLAWGTGRPFYAVNHLEGHIAANLLAHEEIGDHFLTLLVSGGHTMLIKVEGFGNYTVLGRSVDDASGEAFDKVAKILGLGYPGGAEIDRLARQGNPAYIRFPRAIPDPARLDFSFSGLKTAVALYVKNHPPEEIHEHLADIAASFQEAAVDSLCDKTAIALRRTNLPALALSGGVAANSRLRAKLQEICDRLGVGFMYPPSELCTDNAAMIAAAGAIHLMRGERTPFDVNAVPYQKLY
ncbi:MAG: tRNA (adenosine(37)-N6)-threonylcarbamoyltransferase complex transferase subunit TsaD [candidate division Zixibacteria bacterium]|nr:tRNA (adenosine(37)-N6)-threonylcarbamoyltransferase complex transferase subunit TsaD [candidate division Zixibacteria bacterium]